MKESMQMGKRTMETVPCPSVSMLRVHSLDPPDLGDPKPGEAQLRPRVLGS